MTGLTTFFVSVISVIGSLSMILVEPSANFGFSISNHDSIQTHTLKAERDNSGRLYVVVRLNDADVRVLIDTAATHSVIRPSDLRRAKSEATGSSLMKTASGTVTVRTAKIKRVNIEGRSLENRVVLVADTVPVSLIGMDILRDLKGLQIQL